MAYTRLSNYLPSENDRLNLRLVSKSLLEAVRIDEQAPYQTKASFVIAISGQWMMSAKFKINLDAAWDVYSKTIFSKSVKPALIYKLKEKGTDSFIKKLTEFCDGENIDKMGRKYDTKVDYIDHCWALNEIWMLAQFHRGRDFTILASVSEKNKKRREHIDKYSAFAREIAAANKVGYEHCINGKYLSLKAPPISQLRNITLFQIKATPHEVEQAYQLVAEFAKNNGLSAVADVSSMAAENNNASKMIRMLATSAMLSAFTDITKQIISKLEDRLEERYQELNFRK